MGSKNLEGLFQNISFNEAYKSYINYEASLANLRKKGAQNPKSNYFPQFKEVSAEFRGYISQFSPRELVVLVKRVADKEKRRTKKLEKILSKENKNPVEKGFEEYIKYDSEIKRLLSKGGNLSELKEAQNTFYASTAELSEKEMMQLVKRVKLRLQAEAIAPNLSYN